jgi:beta-1,2-mannobiose phosphorylase / 1,2-beta-oligomannan phosphorylase
MGVFRSPENPIIKPDMVKPSRSDFEVIGTFNAGVTRFGDKVLLLLRVAERPISPHPDIQMTAVYDPLAHEVVIKEFSRDDAGTDFSDPRMIIGPDGKFLTSLSHLRVATSTDGIHFNIADLPAMFPDNRYETFGLEDPRITKIDDIWYIDYVAVSGLGVVTCLASTTDFESFERYGIIFCPDNKDVVIFPEKIHGAYCALHRPVTPLFGKYEMWTARSPDLKCWGRHCYLMGIQPGLWDSWRIGASAVPIRIDAGWLEIYHGVDETGRYCLGAVLLDSAEPCNVLARSKTPILQPETDYEVEGFFGNVVFNCGLLAEEGLLKIYYGVSDTSIAFCQIPMQDVLDNLEV